MAEAPGLSLDGEDYVESSKNGRETSLRVGAFGYRGDGEGPLFRGTGHHGSSFAEDKNFTRAGVDVNVYWRDLNLIAASSAAEIQSPFSSCTKKSMERKTSMPKTSTPRRRSSSSGSKRPSPTKDGSPSSTTSSYRGCTEVSATSGWIHQVPGARVRARHRERKRLSSERM